MKKLSLAFAASLFAMTFATGMTTTVDSAQACEMWLRGALVMTKPRGCASQARIAAYKRSKGIPSNVIRGKCYGSCSKYFRKKRTKGFRSKRK